MNNSFCKYGNECRNSKKKQKIEKIIKNNITCNSRSNSNKKKCITNKLVKNVVSNAVREETIDNNFSLNGFKSKLDKACLQKEKNGEFASLDECITKVELKTDMVFKEDTITMDKEKSKVYSSSDDGKFYYDLYIDFTKFFENIFKKKCTSKENCNNGKIRKIKIGIIKNKILEKFNEKNKIYNVKLKNKGKITQVKFDEIEIENLVNKKKKKKFYLIVTFKIDDFFSNIVWKDKMKNKLRLSKGKIEKALKTTVPGISFLNNINLFYEL
jgi:hypothetical protein